MRPNQRKNWLVERKDDGDSHSDPLWVIIPRLIHASIGKPWNETFSKICQRWPKNSKEGWRARHIANSTVVFDSEVYWWRDVLTVDENGILVRRNNNWVSSWREPEKTVIKLEPLWHYQKINGFWYEMRFVKQELGFYEPTCETVSQWPHQKYYRLVPIFKRQMSSREVTEKILGHKVRRSHSEGPSRALHVRNGKIHPKVGNGKTVPKHVRTAPPPTPGWAQSTVWGTPR